MKLLFLLPSVPRPANSGARIRNAGLLRLASASHQVDVLAFGDPDTTQPPEGVRRFEVVPPLRRTTLNRISRFARSPLPDMAHRLWSPQFEARLLQLLDRERYDAVQAEAIEMAPYLLTVRRAVGRGPWLIYDAHNAEFLLQRRAFETSLGGPRTARSMAGAAYSLVQWKRLEAFERAIVRLCDLTMAVSFHDANQLEALAGNGRAVQVVPNGIDLSQYPFREPSGEDEPTLLFVGTLDYRPNREALEWLVGSVMPLVHQRLPHARLLIVGANPPAWLVAAMQRDDRIAVTGKVEDERPYLERASLFALPMQFGGGSRLKALVAMASGVPILSTGFGMEGIDAVAGEHYLRADDAPQWAVQAARALSDLGLRRNLARSGRTLVEQRYDWQAIAPALNAAYATFSAT